MAKEERKKQVKVDELRGLISSVRDGSFHYGSKEERSLDWSSYTQAQANEVADVLEGIREFVDAASRRLPARPKRMGRPPYPASDVAKALLMQSYFGVSDRVAEGLVRLFREKLGITSSFSYKTIERGYDPGPATELLAEAFRLTNEAGNAHEDTVSFDGSGHPTSSKVNYESIREEQRREGSTSTWPSRRTDFMYSVSAVGVHTKMVAGFRTTDDHSAGELSMFPSVISQAHANCPSMKVVLGDSIYANRKACELISLYGAKPYLFPKRNTTFMSHGVRSWSEMLYGFVREPQKWLEVYHDRSISETSNSMDKVRFPFRIRRRIPARKCIASSLRFCVHNVRRYAYMNYVQKDLVDLVSY
jgi:transposase